MRNKISDLNNILFEQLERLQDDSLTAEQLQTEITRSKAVTGVASTIIENGNLALRAMELNNEGLTRAKMKSLPEFLSGGEE